MKFLFSILLLFSINAFADLKAEKQDQVENLEEGTSSRRVYCDYYADSNTSGYSIYRAYDDQDIGNAIFRIERQCRRAARVSNRTGNGIVCGTYYNKNANRLAYSVYRIRNNQDLGRATIGSFEDCNRAVRHSRRGVFCSTYVQNGRTYWSPYSIRTGEDLGSTLYGSLNRCINSL